MEIQNSVSGLITEFNSDTLTKICSVLKLDENAISAREGNQGALLKIILKYLKGMENEGKAIFEQILEFYIIPHTKSINRVKLPLILDLENLIDSPISLYFPCKFINLPYLFKLTARSFTWVP